MTKPATLILGLGRDVGIACAKHFKDEGHNVLVAIEADKEFEKARSQLPDEIVLHHGDLDSHIGLRNILTAASEAFGRHDNLIIIPPIPAPCCLEEVDMTAFDKSIGEGVRAGTLAIALFRSALRDQEPLEQETRGRPRQAGSVTFVLSLAAQLHNPGHFIEAVSQNAMLGVVRAGALELADERIRVNAISAVRPRAEDSETWLKTRTPLGRPSLADEIADAAVYLSSPAAAIITGETLTLDGGRTKLGGTLRNGSSDS
ncbi:MAG: SDR family oxidoreductase [Pseudomonadota bacterium]